MKHVPYRDQAVAVQDLGAGRIHVMAVCRFPTLSPLLQSGAVRLLAVTTRARTAAAPDVPTTTEAGYPAADHRRQVGLLWVARHAGHAARPDLGRHSAMRSMTRRSRPDSTPWAHRGAAAMPTDFARSVEEHRRHVHDIVRIIGLKPPSSSGAQ